MPPCAHAIDTPSPWVTRWAGAIRPGGRVLDVACGSGRHLRYLKSIGFEVVGVDRDEIAIAGIDATEVRVADIEAVYAEWSARGAEFLTPPQERATEIRCFIRDPDGHLIEVGQSHRAMAD